MESEERLSISAKGSATVLQNIIGGISGLIALFFIARNVPKGFYGMYAFVLSLYNLYLFMVDLGVSSAYIKRYTERKYSHDDLFNTYMSIKIVLTALIVIGSFLLVYAVLPLFGYRLFDATTQSLFNTMLLWILFEGTVLSVLGSFIRANLSYVTINLISASEAVARAILQIIVALLYKSHMIEGTLAAELLLISFIISRALNMGLLFLLSKRLIMRFKFSLNLEIIKDIFKFSIPLAISGAVIILSANIDKIMLGWIFTSADVADYNAVQRYARFISNIAMGISQIFFVKVAIDVHRKSIPEIERYLRDWEETIAIILAPAIPLTYVLSDNLITIFLSNQYVTASSTFFILVLTYILLAIRSPLSSTFLSFNKQWTAAGIAIFTNALNVVLNLLLIPRMRSFGAAFATFISVGALGSLLTYLLLRDVGLKRLGVRSHLYLLLALPLGPLAYVLKPYLYRVFTFVPAVVLMYLGYLVLMRLLNVLDKEKFEIIMGMLSIRNIKRTFIRELERIRNNSQ
ncbi:MAG: hypothetical protein DRN26_01010 [Thermoplasmata archaeon]|nr:MAG: hypothetical protein DRN26_01010 [Thermoplasmata archaeon]